MGSSYFIVLSTGFRARLRFGANNAEPGMQEVAIEGEGRLYAELAHDCEGHTVRKAHLLVGKLAEELQSGGFVLLRAEDDFELLPPEESLAAFRGEQVGRVPADVRQSLIKNVIACEQPFPRELRPNLKCALVKAVLGKKTCDERAGVDESHSSSYR